MTRVAVTGSHGTGKSAVCRAVREDAISRGLSCRIVDDIALKVVADGLPVGKACTPSSYLAFVRYYLQPLYNSPAEDIVLHDRWIGDLFAYMAANGVALEGWWEAAVVLTGLVASLYDLIVYVPIEFPLSPKPLRDSDPDYQVAVDRALVRLLSEASIPLLTVAGAVDQRRDTVRAAINGFVK